jgi:hypothetical protein
MSEQILERPMTHPSSTTAPGLPSSPEAAPTQKRTFVVVALAILAGLVIGGLALIFLVPTSQDEVLEPVASAPGAGAAATSAETQGQAEEAAAAELLAAKKAKVRIASRDPFAPLVAKPAPEPPPPAPAPAQAAAAAPAPDAASSSSTSASTSSSTTGAQGGTISALTISPLGDSVTLKLDGKKYSVDEGEEFAKSYRLYNIFNTDCAGFLYGDQNAVVCEGDSITIG